ncbi:MAG: hypothetical protein IT423_14775, partial [Pirellulaceae bacterium]|nr:hypothetical protein [Pirellulaceae bacterium]
QQDPSALTNTLNQLRTFNEPRYLHQTTRRSKQEPMLDMVDDLPIAMESWLAAAGADINLGNATQDNTAHGNIAQAGPWPEQAWRIHFHVPIYVDTFGQLRATQADITQAVVFLEAHQEDRIEGAPWFTGDYEVETYAWGVLPAELQASSLAEGIARELQYLQGVLNQLP